MSKARPLFAPIALLLASFLPAQTCQAGWTPNLFTDGGINGVVNAFIAFDDDGPGPHLTNLIAGGNFTEAGGAPANNIARWDGHQWTPLGSGLLGPVNALAVYDDDGPGPHLPVLIAGGSFGGSAYIAQWNGTSWNPLGSGLSGSSAGAGTVLTLLVFDEDGSGPMLPHLFAGGDFSSAGGIPASGLARWDGAGWSVVGTPQYTVVTQLGALDPDGSGPTPSRLVAAGYLATLGQGHSAVAIFSAGTWTVLGGQFDRAIKSLATFDPDGPGPFAEVLIVGGAFTSVGGVTLNALAQWTGSTWIQFGFGIQSGSTTPGSVNSMVLFDADGPGSAPPALFVCGAFGFAGGIPTLNVARWNGTGWSAVSVGLSGTETGAPTSGNALIAFDDDGPGPHPGVLYVGGDFTAADAVVTRSVATWTGTQWSKLGSAIEGDIRVLIEHDPDGPGGSPPLLVAGGTFSIFTLYGTFATNIAAWNGLWWAPLGPGPGGSVSSAAVFDLDGLPATPPSLVVAGSFGLKSWNGSTWTSIVSPGITVTSLAVYDQDGPGPIPPRLFAGGYTAYPPIPPGGSWYFTPELRFSVGGGWAVAGGSLGYGTINALAVVDEDGSGPAQPVLVAAGSFTPGAGPLNNIVKWNGTSLAPLGQGLGFSNESINTLCAWDPDGLGPMVPQLVAGGNFTTASGTPVNHLASWSNGAWHDVGGGITYSAYSPGPITLASIDLDGAGPANPVLAVGGLFQLAGSLAVNNLALWNGASWSTLGTGITGGGAIGSGYSGGEVHAFATFDDDGPGPLTPALYAVGIFTQAGGVSSGHIARWSLQPALTLGLSTASPSSPLVITNASCVPFAHYFDAFSTDPLNATAPGAGILGGLHIATSDVIAQFLAGVAPFVGVLDASGGASYVVPHSVIAPLSGLTLYGVSVLYSPAPLYPFLATTSAVSSIGL